MIFPGRTRFSEIEKRYTEAAVGWLLRPNGIMDFEDQVEAFGCVFAWRG